ncbi:hypothetical protein SARC_00200 [Sphaeroforma arctica JP610]|uniref:Uncharacterized protein n=1 Tax=Sphaeroforma arctica JP610 TaxID=667725 RepID=A0A0L0GH86_9EUKA|nr:hypothetical protein SARC_00200 [Sphaeroforma arctica JP610]KNC87693.1 hypothetical protein SARC_00200 [Sphaeroforma arctica JP610]|eukprot:XP_014161595.1 hypothetical protein SARC_00200 [Sphaeroforma arctica JP610]
MSVPDADNNSTRIQTETSPVECDTETSEKTGSSSIGAGKEYTSSQMRITASSNNDNGYTSSELPGELEHRIYQAEIHSSGAPMRGKLATNRNARLAAKRSKTLGKSRVLMTCKSRLYLYIVEKESAAF